MDWDAFCREHSIGMHKSERYLVLRSGNRKMFVPLADFPEPDRQTVGVVVEALGREARRLEESFLLSDWMKTLEFGRLRLDSGYTLSDHYIRMAKQREKLKRLLPRFTYQQLLQNSTLRP